MTIVSKEEYARRREAWYAWLRDPANKQTTGALRRSGTFVATDGYIAESMLAGFCCLGGACEVYHAETQDGAWGPEEGHDGFEFGDLTQGNFNDGKDYIRSYTSLPDQVRNWLGFVSHEGTFLNAAETLNYIARITARTDRYTSDSIPNHLTQLNDGRWLTFPQIADFCARNPAGLWQEGTF